MNDIEENKIKTFYLCTDCNYRTEIKQHFIRHLDTIKHITNVRNNKLNKSQKYLCKCGKTYTFIKDGIEEIIMVCSETKQTFNNPYTTIVCPKNLL